MIEANEAKKIALENPTFERKLELYQAVSERIKNAAEAGEDHFTVTDEEDAALSTELKAKGYSLFKPNPNITGVSLGGVFDVSNNFMITIAGKGRKYYFR